MSFALKQHLEQRFYADQRDQLLIIDQFKPLVLPDDTALLRKGDISKKIYYVVSGALQVYRVNEDHREKTVDLAIADEWCADIIGFSTGLPTLDCIRTVGHTELLEIDKPGLNRLMDRVPGFRNIYRGILEETIRRNDGFISLGQKARVDWMKEHRPGLLRQIPLALVASYLGIAEELLLAFG